MISNTGAELFQKLSYIMQVNPFYSVSNPHMLCFMSWNYLCVCLGRFLHDCNLSSHFAQSIYLPPSENINTGNILFSYIIENPILSDLL